MTKLNFKCVVDDCNRNSKEKWATCEFHFALEVLIGVAIGIGFVIFAFSTMYHHFQ